MANVILSWPANPPEEEVSGYNVFMDGVNVGNSVSPGFTVPDVVPGIHEFSVAPVNVWGQGPISDPARTSPAAGKVPSISMTINITIP